MGKEARRKRDKKKAKQAKQGKQKQQAKQSGGRTFDLDEDMMAALRRQRQAFEERFGRPIGPEDPIFFDPDLDVPTPITPVKMEAMVTDRMAAAGVDPALIYAHQHTGLLLTEENLDLVTEADRQEWTDAVERYRRTHPQPVDSDEVREMVVQLTMMMVDLVVADDGETFFAYVDMLPEDEDEGFTVTLVSMNLMGWLVGARDSAIADTAITEAISVAQDKVPSMADALDAVADLLRRSSGETTLAEMFDRVDDDKILIVVMMTLTASLITTLGHSSTAAMLAELGLNRD
jgi:hypothetical protein